MRPSECLTMRDYPRAAGKNVRVAYQIGLSGKPQLRD